MSFVWQYPAVVTRIYDGDSLFVDLQMSAVETQKDVEIRVEGINAVELHTQFGGEARDALAGLLPVGSAITLVHHAREKYGRFLARPIRADGVDVALAMLTLKASDGVTPLAVPYLA